MVVTRNTGSNAELFTRKSKEYFDNIYGSQNFTLIQIVETRNAAGRLSGSTETTTTISGDLQFDNKLLKEYMDLGKANSGDGIFYCEGSSAAVVNNKIIFDGVKWELTKQVEGEYIQDTVPYKGFIVRRIPDA